MGKINKKLEEEKKFTQDAKREQIERIQANKKRIEHDRMVQMKEFGDKLSTRMKSLDGKSPKKVSKETKQ